MALIFRSGLKALKIFESNDSNPLNTDKIRIKAAVQRQIPNTEIPDMILIALVDFLPNK